MIIILYTPEALIAIGYFDFFIIDEGYTIAYEFFKVIIEKYIIIKFFTNSTYIFEDSLAYFIKYKKTLMVVSRNKAYVKK